MSDDLSAFFAKKAQKSKDKKKKAVVNLDEVAQQLERKAKIQELGEFELDEDGNPKDQDNEFQKLGPKSTIERRVQNNEDSEWIEFNEKPALTEVTFREFVEQPDEEIEEEKKGNNSENVKTWNIVKEQTNDEPVIKQQVKAVYQPPGQARKATNLDINNEEMFPSIGDADKIEEKIKAEEKKKGSMPTKAEEPFETMRGSVKYDASKSGADRGAYVPRQDRYEPPRPRFEAPPGRPSSGRRMNESSDTQVSSTEDSWRRTVNPSTMSSPSHRTDTASAISKSSEDDNWRSAKRPAAATVQQSPQRQVNDRAPQPPTPAATQQPDKARYVPPSMRNRMS